MNVRITKDDEDWKVFNVILPNDMYEELKEYLMNLSELVDKKVLP